jgi:hypothetical protein
MARALYILVSILLFPLLLANLSICAWSSATAMGLTSDSSLLLWLVSLVIALFFWFSAAATRRMLSGEAPAGLGVLWLPSLIGNLVAVYLFFICIALRTDEFSRALFSPGALAGLGDRQRLVVIAGTVGMMASVIGMGWLEPWRQAIVSRDNLDENSGGNQGLKGGR